MESKLGRKKLEILKDERELRQNTALSAMKSFQIIDDQFATISFSVINFFLDKSMIVGMTISDLAKRFMFHFHYQNIETESNFDITFLRHGYFFMPSKLTMFTET